MLVISVIIFVVVIFAVIYVFLTMPRISDTADLELQSTDYAHRGLHSASVPENSMMAFTLARDSGYGIELDVRMSRDGKILVFHDENLLRMCGKSNNISDLTYQQIRSLYLNSSNEHIPLLDDVLKLIDGRVPLLIEIKTAKNKFALCKNLSLLLDTYHGAFAIQSFDPQILNYFKKYRPRFARGQLVTKISKKERKKDDICIPKNPFICFALTHMLTNIISRPDFISIDGKHLKEPAFIIATKVFHSKGFVWVVRTPRQHMLCKSKGLLSIFENIRPQ